MSVCVCGADIDIPRAAEAEANVFKVSALSSQPGVPEVQKREGERGKGVKGTRERDTNIEEKREAMKEGRNTKADEMNRQTQREESATERERERENILREDEEKKHFCGVPRGEITQMSLKAPVTVFALSILAIRQTDRETDGHRGSGGCRDGQ